MLDVFRLSENVFVSIGPETLQILNLSSNIWFDSKTLTRIIQTAERTRQQPAVRRVSFYHYIRPLLQYGAYTSR